MTKTPRPLGYSMPPEWAPHRGTWLSWPHKEESWPGKFAPVPAVFAEMVRGRQGEAANQRRCRLFVEVKHDMSIFYNQTIRRTANLAFEHYWHVPFCASR